MNERNDRNTDPWERDYYTTGSTNPPKSHSGLVASLLVAVILLCGVATALGLMNVRLFRQLREKDNCVSFLAGTVPSQTATDPNSFKLPTEEVIDLELQPAPTNPDFSLAGMLSYEQIYEKSIPSVVSIVTTTRGGSASGTGVILSEKGYIVTNAHVIDEAVSIQVRLSDGQILTAYTVGTDTVSDLAVLYVDAQGLTPAEFGDSAFLKVGQSVAAIGDPLGPEFRGTMTDGIVSAINRNITVGGRAMTLIQTNAALNSGNSGGPLINGYGQVVGINTMKISAFVDGVSVEGLGFAIPSTTVKEIVDQLIAQGFVSGRPTPGFRYETVTELDQRYYDLPAGALVLDIREDSNAAAAGISSGDIILSFNGQKITCGDDLTAALYSCKAGDTVQMTLYRYRNHSHLTVNLILEETEG